MYDKLRICWAILFLCKHERVGQFIEKRTAQDLYYRPNAQLARDLTRKYP